MSHNYTNAHRYIVQKFLLCGPAYRKDINRFISEAAEVTKIQLGTTDKELIGIFQAINAKMASVGMRIQRVTNEVSGSVCYTLINTNPREVIDWKSDYSEKEVEFIVSFIGEIAQSDIRELTRIDLMRIAHTCKISNADSNRIINELTDMAYLQLVPTTNDEEVFCFGTRFVAEMYDYMERTYGNTLPKCGSCKRLIFNQGFSAVCGNCGHDCPFHSSCKKKSISAAQSQSAQSQSFAGLSCPSCKAILN